MPSSWGREGKHLRVGVWLAYLAGLSMAALGCQACRGVGKRPNILVVVVDSLRADHLHHAGDARHLSPSLDRLAEQGARFLNAYSAAPWTTPSVMTLMTGLTPAIHHVDDADRTLHSSVKTLAERFKAAGYATCAVMPALTLAAHLGFDRGFDQFIFENQGHSRVSGPWSTAQALAFLRENAGRPSFLYVHMWDVHYNYNPPVPYALKFQAGRPPGPGENDDVTARVLQPDRFEELPPDRLAWLEGQYAGEILFTDEEIGHILKEVDRLGRAENTIIVVTADHGEAFQEHGRLGHTVHLYEEQTHVPLLVRWPGHIAPARILRPPVGLVDLAPTLLELAGIPFVPERFEGRSHAADLLETRPTANGAGPGGERWILQATSRRAEARGLRSARWAYLYDFAAGREELYDLRADPGEQVNLAASHREEASAARHRLCERLAWTLPGGEIPVQPLDPGIQAMLAAGLRSLGYVGGSEAQEGIRRPPRTENAASDRRETLEILGCDLLPGS